MAPASVSDVVKAEGVNYLRVLSAFGSLFGGKGPRWVIYVSEAWAGPGMRQIFYIVFFFYCRDTLKAEPSDSYGY